MGHNNVNKKILVKNKEQIIVCVSRWCSQRCFKMKENGVICHLNMNAMWRQGTKSKKF